MVFSLLRGDCVRRAARSTSAWRTDYCFGGGAPPAPAAGAGAAAAAPVAGPRGSFLLAMQFFKNFAFAAPCSFWSSAPNLQVAIFSFAVTANDGALGSMAINMAVKKMVR
jgi:hypothetical protein